MKKLLQININKILYFTRWSRKKYAILASIAKVVHIGKLSVKTAECSLNKLDKSITLTSNILVNIFNDTFDIFSCESIGNSTISKKLIPITVNSKIEKTYNLKHNNTRLSN